VKHSATHTHTHTKSTPKHADLGGLGVALDVGKEEVIQTDLATKQTGHVHFVGVQRAVQDLEKKKKDRENLVL
jgi:hypothetical protein